MLTEGTLAETRILSRRGVGIEVIARGLEIARSTMRHWLREEAVREMSADGPGWRRLCASRTGPRRAPSSNAHGCRTQMHGTSSRSPPAR